MTDEEKRGNDRLLRFVRSGPLAMYASAWGNEFEIAILGGPRQAPPDFERVDDLAIVDIGGPDGRPIVHHKHWCWDSYDEIVRRAAAAFASDAAKVYLRVNSPGGDVDGCFDAARSLRALAIDSNKPLLAYVDGMAASAAYALACAAKQIVVSSTSTVGSIGIVEALRSQVEADEKMGQQYEFVTSGEHKSDGNPHVPITAKAVANLQGQVDGMAELFFELVRDLRGIPVEKTRGLQARVFFGANAVAQGLADAVQTWSQLTRGKERTSGAQQMAPSGEKMGAQASYLRHFLKSLAESEDEDVSETERKHAKRMLKMLEEGSPDEGAPPSKKDDKGDAKNAKKAEDESESEGEGKKGKRAEDEGEGKKASKAEGEGEGEGRKAKAEDESEGEGEGEGKKAKATSSMASRLQSLEAREAARESAAKRSALMATRPDLTKEVRDWLDSEPVEVVERALKTLPKGPVRPGNPLAAASQAGGTRGKTQVDDGEFGAEIGADLQAHMDRKMGVARASAGVQRKGTVLELGYMSPAQAQAFLKKQGIPDVSAADASGKED